MSATTVVALIPVSDARTGVAHLVTERAMIRGCAHGRYAAVCGADVLAASLTAPDSDWCRRCRVWRAGR